MESFVLPFHVTQRIVESANTEVMTIMTIRSGSARRFGQIYMAGAAIDEHWTRPWRGRIGTNLAGVGETTINEVVARTLTVAERLT